MLTPERMTGRREGVRETVWIWSGFSESVLIISRSFSGSMNFVWQFQLSAIIICLLESLIWEHLTCETLQQCSSIIWTKRRFFLYYDLSVNDCHNLLNFFSERKKAKSIFLPFLLSNAFGGNTHIFIDRFYFI